MQDAVGIGCFSLWMLSHLLSAWPGEPNISSHRSPPPGRRQREFLLWRAAEVCDTNCHTSSPSWCNEAVRYAQSKDSCTALCFTRMKDIPAMVSGCCTQRSSYSLDTDHQSWMARAILTARRIRLYGLLMEWMMKKSRLSQEPASCLQGTLTHVWH